MQEVAVKYFKNLFESQRTSNFDEILEAINPRVKDEMNNFLQLDFVAEEIHKVMRQIHPTKAPSSDGMLALFFS